MSLTSCVHCASKESIIAQEARRAIRRDKAGLPVTKQVAEIARLKAELKACEHTSVDANREATRRRHARARGEL